MGQSQTNPIHSELIIHDERRTIIVYKTENNETKKYLIPYDFYEIIAEHLPNLDRETVETMEKSTMSNSNHISSSDMIEAKLKKLQEMKNSGLIDENDYKTQKEKLLEKL